MPFLESLEQRGLFRLTRFVAFAIVTILSITLLIGCVVFMSDFVPNHESHISYGRISEELHPVKDNDATSRTQSHSLPDIDDDLKLPFVLQSSFVTQHDRDVLKRHLSGLDSDEREEYLDNLAEVARQAKDQGADVTDVINRYFEDKESQMTLAKLDRTARLERQLSIAGAAVSTIFLIALASLVLVLLAIERNTRKPSENSHA